MDYKPRKTFQPSPEQSEYFRWTRVGKGNAILIAVAGAGKSTTLIQGLREQDGNIVLAAYNKNACEDLKQKAEAARVDRQGVRIMTKHGQGWAAWRQLAKSVVVKDSKVKELIDTMIAEQNGFQRVMLYQSFLSKLVSLAKNYLIGVTRPNEPQEWMKLVQHFGLDEELPENVSPLQAIEDARLLFQRSHETCMDVIDFDDMLYAPLAYNARFFRNDWVIDDEAQDTNPARLELSNRTLARYGRYVAVGDPKQAIYGFSGAMGDSMDQIRKRFKCRDLTLTVSYRCPQKVVIYAQQWVPYIKAHATAPEGIVRSINYSAAEITCTGCDGEGHHMIQGEFPVPCRVCKGKKKQSALPWFLQDRVAFSDAILCRKTAPLVRTAHAMLRANVPCKVEGRDIGKSIIQLSKRWRVKTLEALEDRLSKHLIAEVQKAKKDKSERRAMDVADRVDTLRVFIERARARGERTIDGIEQDIMRLFADDVKGVTTLSTGHKAKGREWPRVFWIQVAPLDPSRMQPWEAEQEQNILYVIATRAQAELVFVPEALLDSK